MEYKHIIVCLTLSVCSTWGNINTPPEDSAVAVGDSVTLICGVSSCSTQQWLFDSYTGDDVIITTSNGPYELIQESGYYNLQITASDMTVAGQYKCQCGSDIISAYLTVLDPPECATDPVDVVEDQNLFLLCTNNYAQEYVGVNIEGDIQVVNYDDSGFGLTTQTEDININEEDQDDPYSRQMNGNTTITPAWDQHEAEYYCLVTYGTTYEKNCTYTLLVQHSAKNFSLLPYSEEMVYYPGDTITAVVNAYPEPKQYVWTNLRTNMIVDEDSPATITIPAEWPLGNTTLQVDVTNYVDGGDVTETFYAYIDLSGANAVFTSLWCIVLPVMSLLIVKQS